MLPLLNRRANRAIDRFRHHVGHQALAALLGVGTSLWHRALQRDFVPPPRDQIMALRRWFLALLDEDFANSETGYYPRELVLDFPAAELLRTLPEAVRDVPRMLLRARDKVSTLEVPADDRYPDYYKRTFHWQVDGWLSAHSARIYDLQVEVLFFGTMDMMRRCSLPPLVRALKDAPAPRVLDVACGTGKLLRHIQTVLPKARVFGVDLSPHYVQRAQAKLADLPGVSFLVGNAEQLPLSDGTFDAVTCGFLFHELPGDARRRVLSEMHRVLKPGGILVFQDAAQAEDQNVKDMGFYLEVFPRVYHEPYFKGWMKDAIEPLCEAAGLTVKSSSAKLFSKVVVAEKR